MSLVVKFLRELHALLRIYTGVCYVGRSPRKRYSAARAAEMVMEDTPDPTPRRSPRKQQQLPPGALWKEGEIYKGVCLHVGEFRCWSL